MLKRIAEQKEFDKITTLTTTLTTTFRNLTTTLTTSLKF